MNRRRALVILGFVMAPGSVVAASCSFPELPTFTPDQDGALAETSAADDGATDGAADGDGRVVPTDVDPEGGSQEAAIPPEGGGMIDASGCASPCDCDGDGFQTLGNGCDGGPGPRPDCEDLNPFIKPNAGFVATTSWTSGHMPLFDWNCDGDQKKQYYYNVACDVTSCSQGVLEGFVGNPDCGQSGTYDFCKYTPGIGGLLATCKVDATKTVVRVQGCQ